MHLYVGFDLPVLGSFALSISSKRDPIACFFGVLQVSRLAADGDVVGLEIAALVINDSLARNYHRSLNGPLFLKD